MKNILKLFVVNLFFLIPNLTFTFLASTFPASFDLADFSIKTTFKNSAPQIRTVPGNSVEKLRENFVAAIIDSNMDTLRKILLSFYTKKDRTMFIKNCDVSMILKHTEIGTTWYSGTLTALMLASYFNHYDIAALIINTFKNQQERSAYVQQTTGLKQLSAFDLTSCNHIEVLLRESLRPDVAAPSQ